MLARTDEARFGRMLAAEGWSWDLKAHFWVNHYGTGALIAMYRHVIPFSRAVTLPGRLRRYAALRARPRPAGRW
jgi:hypothetical protein